LTENLERLLSEHEFFAGLDPKYLDTLVGCASNVHYNTGEYIIREGTDADKFFVIRHGSVVIEIYSAAGGPVSIMTLGPGDVMGWSWLVEPYKWHFDARAAEGVRATVLDATCLRGKCESDHELGYQLLKRIVGVMENRLSATIIQMLDIYGKHR